MCWKPCGLCHRVQVAQTGARGGLTSLFIRGGNSNFNKVLLDGVSANDVGGSIDLGQIAATGIDRVEVLREPNSVLYGSDALTGVINLTTRRGQTRVPELHVSLDAGNFGTSRQEVAVGGVVRRFDYFSDFSHFDTDNEVPNNQFRNNTYAGRFGVALGRSTDISGTVRLISTEYGVPNAIESYGIPDDSGRRPIRHSWPSTRIRRSPIAGARVFVSAGWITTTTT